MRKLTFALKVKMLLALFFLFTHQIGIGLNNKIDTKCDNLQCDGISEEICAIKIEGEGFRLRQFQNGCNLLKYQCVNKDETAFEIIGMDYCLQAFKTDNQTSKLILDTKPCAKQNCSNFINTKEICTIRNDGEGFRIRIFENECQLSKFNCENGANFTATDFHICNSMHLYRSSIVVDESVTENASSKLASSINKIAIAEDNSDDANSKIPSSIDNITETEDKSEDAISKIASSKENKTGTWDNPTHDNDRNSNKTNANDKTKFEDGEEPDGIIEDIAEHTDNDDQDKKPNKTNNLIVVRSSLIDFSRINDSVKHFFAATHILDLPVKEVDRTFLNESTRRKLIKVAGPIKVFVPWVTIPKNISDDFDYRPTLSTCYHKCPRKCPSTYAPVCGVPGILAREPSLMFQNHCFMDVAQCKMFWENKSPTALSSSYVESSFLFCLGEEMNGMYRFLPLIKTLQHMGRLRKKGRFHYRFNNMKFFNTLLAGQPKFMG